MKQHNTLMMPARCSMVESHESFDITGGSNAILNFISYILGGFNVSFGSNNRHSNSDTITSVDGSRTSSGYVVHSNVDNITRNQYGGWSANFNLGGLFSALVRLFSAF